MDRGTSTALSVGMVSGNEMTRVKVELYEQRPNVQAKAARPDQAMALFARLPDDLLTRLFAKARTLNLAAKAELFPAGAPGDECYRVERGSLKVSVTSKNG